MKSRWLAALLTVSAIGLVAGEVSAQAPPCGTVTDQSPRIPPPVVPPATGGSYVDPAFGCTITRLSNAAAEGLLGVTHVYATRSPFNANSTRVLMEKHPGGIMHIRNLSGGIVLDDLWRVGINPRSDAVWSTTNPDIIYYHRPGTVGGPDNEIWSYNVASNEATRLHSFSSCIPILPGPDCLVVQKISFGDDQGDLSADGDHLAIVANDQWGLRFQISTLQVTAGPFDLLVLSGGLFTANDVLDMTPSNGMLLKWTGTDPWNGGINYFDSGTSTWTRPPEISWSGHSDRARDGDGKDLEVTVNANEPWPPVSGCVNGVVKIRLVPPPPFPQTCLQSFDWSLAHHVSCNNVGQGWCLVSTHNGIPGRDPYANELLKRALDLKGPLDEPLLTVRFAHSRSTNAGYDYYPRVAVSRDGRYGLFNSDMGTGVVDVWLLHLP